MDSEKRSAPRLSPYNLKATITIEHASERRLDTSGRVLDISNTGVKIKLDRPLIAEANHKVKIDIILPETGIPFTISGIIKRRVSSFEYGLQYADNLETDKFDDLIFECTKQSDKPPAYAGSK
jgi:hypothetical protein